MTLRILAGRLKGATLLAPADTGLRPSSAKLREAVFDILRARLDGLEGIRIADLFAGTGAVGIEALSQGAAHVIFVERDPIAAELIRRNLGTLRLEARATLMRQDATRLAAAKTPVDVAFLDPPYGRGLVEPCLARLLEGGWLTPETVVLAEVARQDRLDPPPGVAVAREHPHGAGRLLRLEVRGSHTTP